MLVPLQVKQQLSGISRILFSIRVADGAMAGTQQEQQSAVAVVTAESRDIASLAARCLLKELSLVVEEGCSVGHMI